MSQPPTQERTPRHSVHSDATALEEHQLDASSRDKPKDLEQGISINTAGKPEPKVIDAVWGEVDGDGPGYRTLSWQGAAILETKVQIGLGVLGLPSVLNTLGYGPGIILILLIGGIITWSDYVVGTFKRNHPEVYTVADVGYIFFGRVGREFWGFIYWLQLTAIAGSGMLSFSIALNALSDHGTCTVVFVVVGAIIAGIVSSLQTLNKISWLGWVGFLSIVGSVITLAVATGVNSRPALAPQEGSFEIITYAARALPFVDVMNAINTIIFAYAGTPNFYNIVGEMRDQKEYTKSVLVCQTVVTAVYLVIGCTVYHFTGQYIASPALGSAGILMKKVCYGLALPGLLVGCILNTHMPAKYVFVRIMRGSRHLSRNTPIHYAAWFGCVAFNCTLSFIIAESIPIFDNLLSLIGALLGSFLCIQTEAFMWLYDTWRLPRNSRWWALTAMNVLFVILGFFATVGGTYAAVVMINESLKSGNQSNPFSCADNS